MGIITEAVICNLAATIDSINAALHSIEYAEMNITVGFRDPFDRKENQQKFDDAKKALISLVQECKDRLELEKKHL